MCRTCSAQEDFSMWSLAFSLSCNHQSKCYMSKVTKGPTFLLFYLQHCLENWRKANERAVLIHHLNRHGKFKFAVCIFPESELDRTIGDRHKKNFVL